MDAGNKAFRLTLGAAFLLMGFTFSITQVVLIRELMVSFSGNELSIGLVLGNWFLLEALGSWLLGRLFARAKDGKDTYACLQVALALILPLTLYAAFNVRQLTGAVPGQGLSTLTSGLVSFLLLIPVALVDGAMFTIGCQAASDLSQGDPGAVRRVYVLEALGGIAGGLVFTYGFIPHLQTVQIVLLLSLLNLGSATSLLLLTYSSSPSWARASWASRPGTLTISTVLLAGTFSLLVTPEATRLHRQLMARQWPGFELAFYGNSPYGSVAAIRRQEQTTFLANGVPILSSPMPDVAQVEEMVHLPLLFVRQPTRVLILSGGLGGVIHELLKYPLERVDYAELDPLLIQAVASLPSPLTESELADPRLHVEQIDGRLLVNRLAALPSARKETEAAYDLILINLPYPTTLQLNRFYTVEFWCLIHRLLAEGGVVAFQMPGSLSYLSPALRDLHNALYSALKECFAHVRSIPDDTTIWLASSSVAVETIPPEVLITRWQARRVPSSLITPPHIRLKLDERRLAWFWDSLQAGRPVVKNQDLHPSALLYGLAYWNEQFSPRLAPYLGLVKGISLPTLLMFVLLLAIGGTALVRLSPRSGHRAITSAIAVTGFAGMSADLLIIFAFQVFYGYVYHFVGLLVTAFMAGLSFGGWTSGRRQSNGTDYDWGQTRHRMLCVEGMLLLYWLVLPLILILLRNAAEQEHGLAVAGPALMALNALAGFLVGAQFPLGNRLYRRFHPHIVGTAGALYASDLIGACVASIAVSAVLLPVLGIIQTCLLVAALKAGSGLLLLVMRDERGA